MGDLTKNFNASEFGCKCGCGYCSPSFKLVSSLQELREEAGVAITIVSGCRCTQHNKNSGSTILGLAVNLKKGNPGDISASAHTRGEAADIRVGGLSKGKLYDLIVAMHKAKKLPWLKYVYKIKNSATNVHVGVDDFKKRATPYGGDG
ncbi:MAG: hypothetical protein LBS53_11000 [Synergistaceae bacterium]|jgi:hypothetical protein|nr:hypothetical protein [Synergistaceae bacterium]